MKYVLVIGDGMADTPLEQLHGKTPLETLSLDAFDRAAGCEYGRARTVPAGMAPGSDTAILSIFGNDPRTCYTGRSALEAAGMGVTVPADGISLRINLCAVEEIGGSRVIHSHNGGGVHGSEAETLMRDLMQAPAFTAQMAKDKLTIYPTDTFRHIGVMITSVKDLSAVKLTEPHNILEQSIEGYLPHSTTGEADTRALADVVRNLMEISYTILKDHPINKARVARGNLPANMIWPWGAATAMALENFEEKYHKRGTVVSAVPLVWGIALLGGLKTPHVPGANGDLDTNYQGKVNETLKALAAGDDFAAVHIEAPDEMAHAGSLEKKLQAIQNVNDLVMRPILAGLTRRGEDFRVLVLSDHPTFLTTRTHDGTPVPYAIFDSRKTAAPRKFCEAEALKQPLLDDGTQLMERLFANG